MKFKLFLALTSIWFISCSVRAQSVHYYGGSKQVNDSIRTLLEAMEEPTLLNRGNYFRARQEFGKDSEQANKMLQKMILDDSLNLIKVQTIYRKYGWPLESQIGELAVGQAFLQIQHGSFKTQLYFLPIMKKAARKGEFTKTHIALLEDRILTNKRKKQKKQLYGTQYGLKINKDGSKESLIWPIKSFPNLVKINNRREKMGLEKISLPRKEYDPGAKGKDFR